MNDVDRIKGAMNISASEEFVGGKLWGQKPVSCQCTRRGGAKLWLFRHHMGIEFEDGQQTEVLDFKKVNLEPSWKAYIQKSSFSVPPVCYAELRVVPLDVSKPPTTVVFTDTANGWEASRSIQFVWQYNNNELSETSHVYLSCNRFSDVVAVASKLPIEEHCTMATRDGVKVPGKLKLINGGLLQFISSSQRPNTDMEWYLEEVLMIRRNKGIAQESIEMRAIVTEGEQSNRKRTEQISFSNFNDMTSLEAALVRAWCLDCNSAVNFRLRNDIDSTYLPSPHRKKRTSVVASSIKELPDKVCFHVSEVMQLLSTFQAMDRDGDGVISRDEWLKSLGSVFSRSNIVPDAVFSVFDTDNDNTVSFPEFLFGCRILHLGSSEDRIKYQYRIFDPSGSGYMTLEQFVTVARALDDAVDLTIPYGEDIPTYCRRVFQQLDTNRESRIEINEFHEAIHSDESFSHVKKALCGLSLANSKANSGKTTTGKPVWFGDPQWQQCTAILKGIKLSQDCRVQAAKVKGKPPRKSDMFQDAFTDKAQWVLESGEIVKNGRARSESPRRRPEQFFTDYCPRVFLALQEAFGVTPEQYKESLGIDQLRSSMLVGSLSNLLSVSSSGRSGAFFFASYDGQFILKTIDKSEGKILRRFLPAYYNHVMKYPSTLLTRYFGLHALGHGGDKMYFLVMNNVMQPPERFPIQLRYDLKGSTVNRTTPLDRRKNDVALKDLDFKRKLEIDSELRRLLMNQIRADSGLLAGEKLNDYSLLIGIHTNECVIDDEPSEEFAQEPFFRKFEGGMLSGDKREIYFVGIIDLLTSFGLRKKGEYTVKSVWYRTGKVSCVPPDEYQERFVQYVESIFPVPTAVTYHDPSPSPPFPINMRSPSIANYAFPTTSIDIISPTSPTAKRV
eukprot:TRINITY_DN3840_c6_g1_i1.p1 TRINITY_DN3840_c6_g1~~TRINITY_DN3840_c6_g1_i1.p1  ORF type:complete len:898 (+),score=186.15 TRINITY_DN3840_c6_g1_i1:149-2842(+)